MRFRGLKIGIPREIMEGELRVASTPEMVAKMICEGAEVLVERDAGKGSLFSDQDYLEAGATIQDKASVLFEQSDVILKVKEPLFVAAAGIHEVEMLKPGQHLITFIHPASPSNHAMVKKLADRGVISLSLDSIPRITRAQAMDALTSMSTVAGYKAVLMAADMLPKFMPMMGTAVGMIAPAKVLVVGVGVAGLQALATAKRLGAEVQAADIRPDACEQAHSLGAKAVELGVPADVAVGEGGYARSLPASWLSHERDRLREAVAHTDILILSALIPGKIAPVLIDRQMVRVMKPGAIIVDIAIDQGGNCELTEGGKTIDIEDIHIIGTKNIPGMVPISSTWMFARNIYNFLSHIVKDGHLTLDSADEIIASALVTRDGKVVHKGALEAMNESEKGK
ncbi:MAG: NAD(P) transhydrogenase subunit alpha [Sedimentisphaerales bacterium]|nr:NAD(P) transhydrogenase subunit alpha [Sedimentisphaerales bacterium]